MQRAYLPTAALLLAGTASAGHAQITLGAATLPEPGDKLEAVVDTAYADANGNIALAGADRTWIFGDLRSQRTACTVYRDASEGDLADDFRDADLVGTTGPRCDGDNAEVYLQRGDGTAGGTAIRIIGLGGSELDLPVVRLKTPLIFQQAPLSFGDVLADTLTQRIEFGGDILSGFVDDPTLVGLVDSIRIDLSLGTEIAADGWGRAGESADALTDVLRVRRETNTSQSISVKAALVGWINLTDLPGLDPTLLPPSTQSIVNYEWWTTDLAGPLYRITPDTFGDLSLAERSTTFVVTSTEAPRVGDRVRVIWTAGTLDVRARGTDGGSEDYAVDVYGTSGANVAHERVAGGRVSIPTASWSAGLYLVRVSDGEGSSETHRVVLTR